MGKAASARAQAAFFSIVSSAQRGVLGLGAVLPVPGLGAVPVPVGLGGGVLVPGLGLVGRRVPALPGAP